MQNLRLAARAEGVGVGWVSMLRYDDLREELGIPVAIQPIAYLCLGHVSHVPEKPELETAGWLPRTPLQTVGWFDRRHQRSGSGALFHHL